MRRDWHFALAGAVVAWPLAAGAQQNIPESLYRPDTPLVLQAESVAVFRNRDATVAQFARVYGTKGRPRIAVFWNRRFDDRLSDWTTGVRVTATESTELDVAVNGERVDGAKKPSVLSGRLDADLKERRTVEAGWRRPEQQRGGLPEGLAFQLESAFTATFAEANVAIVDRALAMRLQNRTVRTSDPDTQRVETDALASHADLLLEVLMAGEPAAPLGMVFQVNVKDVRTGQVVHSLTSDGQAASEMAAARWETGEHGFVRASNRAEIASKIGEELALETMAALAGRWR